MAYTVTAPLVVAHTGSGDVYVYEGGVLPEATDAEQVKQLLATEMVTKDTSAQEEKAPTVPEILAEVGDDPEKAQAILDAERQERGDKARKGLVEKLEAIIAAAGDDEDDES